MRYFFCDVEFKQLKTAVLAQAAIATAVEAMMRTKSGFNEAGSLSPIACTRKRMRSMAPVCLVRYKIRDTVLCVSCVVFVPWRTAQT